MRIITIAALALFGLLAPVSAQEAPPELVVSSDLSALPEPVRAMRERLIEAARTGDIEALRPIMDAQAKPPNVSFGNPEDPIASLKKASADGEGVELLAVMLNLLDAPYGILGEGDDTVYIWPYLAGMTDVSKLTPEQNVDAYRLLTPEQYEEFIAREGWYNWRLVIGADGVWLAFTAGD